MNKKWLYPLLALSALFLFACCVALFFIGARVVTSRASSTCGDTGLTPEQKANCGTHSYQLQEKLTSYCAIMKEDSGVKNITTEFSGNRMTTSIRDGLYIELAANEYESIRGKLSPSSNINRHVYTISLTTNGFTENYAYEGPQGNLIDCWLDTYTLVR